MIARTAFRATLGLSLLVLVAVLIVATQTRAVTSLGNEKLGSRQVVAPVSQNGGAQPAVQSLNGTANLKPGLSGSGTQSAAGAAGGAPGSRWSLSSGPEDAGTNVVYQAPVTIARSCGPAPCKRPTG